MAAGQGELTREESYVANGSTGSTHGEDGQPRDIAARPRQAGDEPAPNRIGQVKTIGIVLVACWTATAEGVLVTTMTSTLSATSSVARAGNRSYFPSASRYSITTLRPST